MSVVVPISSLLLVICLASLFIPQLNLQSDPIFWITYYPIGTTLLDFSYFSFTLLDLSHFLMPDFVFYFVGKLVFLVESVLVLHVGNVFILFCGIAGTSLGLNCILFRLLLVRLSI